MNQFREYVEPPTLVPSTDVAEAESNTKHPPSLQQTRSNLHPATAALLGYGTTTMMQSQKNESKLSENHGTKRMESVSDMPITTDAFTTNLGLPLIVVVTKVSLFFKFN